uniref:Uncharacterized protein n=1 Tax=Triticum urartu TaxID=4572 RepID=A0A8R7PEU6_TRIUA
QLFVCRPSFQYRPFLQRALEVDVDGVASAAALKLAQSNPVQLLSIYMTMAASLLSSSPAGSPVLRTMNTSSWTTPTR